MMSSNLSKLLFFIILGTTLLFSCSNKNAQDAVSIGVPRIEGAPVPPSPESSPLPTLNPPSTPQPDTEPTANPVPAPQAVAPPVPDPWVYKLLSNCSYGYLRECIAGYGYSIDLFGNY